MAKNVTRLYTGPDGESHFGEIKIPFTGNDTTKTQDSEPIPAKDVVFREINSTSVTNWHNAPCRQYYIVLEGTMEIEVGNGTKRKFGPGEMFLAEDTTGKGHTVRNFGRRVALKVRLP
jgi:quercetin dioxygenase-like cupin family protein